MTKRFSVLMMVLAMWFTTAAYPPGKPTLGLSPPTAVASTTVDVTACGFAPESSVNLTLDGLVIGSIVIGDDGCGKTSIVAPATPGSYNLTATSGTGSTASGALIVIAGASGVPATSGPPSPGVTRPLPTTGQSIDLPVRLAAGSLVLGLTALLITARQRRHGPSVYGR